VRRLLPLLLFLGALIGLLGQGVALATVPPVAAAPMAAAGMSEDCMKMMAQQQQQQPADAPCKGLTFACIAAMGCAAPAVLLDAAPLTIAPQRFAIQTFWPTVRLLAGSDLAPEPPPPLA
jgi:hypothetical protein